MFKYDANTCGKSHCNFKLTNINPDVLHSPHEVVGELGRGHNYWNVFSNESPQAEITVKMRFFDWNLVALKYVTRAGFGDFKCLSQLANLRVYVIGWEKGEWAVLCPLGKVYENPADGK